MLNVNPAQLAAWLKLGEAVIGSELVRALLPKIGETLKLSPEQRAAVEANISDYDARIARADAAAGNNDRDDDGS